MSSQQYDPSRGPDPSWAQLPLDERIRQVEGFHRRHRPPASFAAGPSWLAEASDLDHALAHVWAEGMLLSSQPEYDPLRSQVSRLIEEGLDRHEAVHAVALTWMESVQRTAMVRLKDNPVAEMCRDLEELTAERWRSRSGR